MQLKNIGNSLNAVKDIESVYKTLSTIPSGMPKLAQETRLLNELTSKYSVETLKSATSQMALTAEQTKAIFVAAGLADEELEQAVATATVSTSQTTATATTGGLSMAFKGLAASIGVSTTALTVFLAAAAGIAIGVIAFKAYRQHMDELVQSVDEAGSVWEEQNKSLDDNIAKIKELKDALDSGTLTEEEAYDAKSQLLDIQNQLKDSYGEQASVIDLVNGNLETQIGLINKLSKEEANNLINENKQGIDEAEYQMTEKQRRYTLAESTPLSDDVKNLLDQYEHITYGLNGDGQFYTIKFKGDTTAAEKEINDFQNKLKEIDPTLSEYTSRFVSESLSENQKIIDKYQTAYQQGLQWDMYSQGFGENSPATILNEYTEAVNAYNEALSSGNEISINTADKALNEVQSKVDNLLSNKDTAKFATFFDEIESTLNKSAINLKNFQDSFDATTLEHVFKGLDDIDLKSINLDANKLDGVGNALSKVVNKAIELGIVNDNSSESIAVVVDLLAQMGVVGSNSFEDISSPAQEAITDISGMVDSFQTNLQPLFKEIKSAYQDIFTEDGFTKSGISSEMFSGIKDNISKLSENGIEFDISVFDDFVNVLSDAESTANDVQDAFDSLASELIHSALPQVTDDTRDLTVAMLENAGVTNAAQLVDAQLEAQKYATANGCNNLADATYDEIAALINEGNASATAQSYLAQLALSKLDVNNTVINTQADVDNIIAVANAAGVSAAQLANLRTQLNNLSNAQNVQKVTAGAGSILANYQEEKAKSNIQGIFDSAKVNYSRINPSDYYASYSGGKGKGSSGSKGGGSGSDKDAALEAFKDWFSKLFDWVEIKLKRQTDKISRYISKAENALDAGGYTTSASNYRNAINETTTQIKYEQTARSKYNTQANKVLKKAVSQGIVSQKQANSIAKKVKNGTMNISEYSDRIQEVISSYKTFYDKSVDASDAIAELHANIRQYIQDLKKVRDAQRDAKLDVIDKKLSIGTGGVKSSSGGYYGLANSQLSYSNTLLRSQNTAYATEVTNINSDNKKVSTSGKKAINKALKTKDAKKSKKYKKALTNAKKAIAAKKAVSSSDLKTIKSHSITVYEKLYAYNLALDNLETAKLEQAINYATNSSEIYKNIADTYNNLDDATNNNISLYQSKATNTSSASVANSYLDKVASGYNTIITNDNNEIATYTTAVNANKKTISSNTGKGSKYKNASSATKKKVIECINKAKASAKSGATISASVLSSLATYYSKGYVSQAFYQSCINYNNALESKREAEAKKAIDEQTAIQEKAAIGTEKFNNVEQEYTNRLNANQSKTDLITAQQDTKTARGLSLTSADYNSLINQNKTTKQIYENEIVALNNVIKQNLASGYWTTTSQEYIDALQSVSDYKVKVQECATAQEEYNNSLAQLPYDTIEKALELLDAVAEYNKSLSNLKSAQDIDLSESDYLQQMKDNNNQITQYEKERLQAYQDYLKALSNSDKVYGGKTADEWLAEYNRFGTEINNLKADNEELKDSLRDDVYWRAYDRAHEAAKRYLDVLSGIKDLIDSDMYFDSDGKLTKYGVAQIANLVSEYENARKEVENYSNDINNLNQLYADGWYTEEEYKERLAELQSSLLDSASSMKSVMGEIKNMYKDMAQSELDSLFELIDARNEALSAKESYYQYDKNIKGKTKDIQALEQQIRALDGVTDAESRARKAQLEAQLADSKEELNDTINEHLLEISQKGLDDLKETLQDAFDDKWDNISGNLEEIAKLMASANTLASTSTSTINAILNELLKYYGINPVSAEIKNVMGYAKGTKYVPKSGTYLTDENGDEIIITKQGILRPLSQGDGVIPSKLTERLYEMAENYPSWKNLTPQITKPEFNIVPNRKIDGINPVIECPITIMGNANEQDVVNAVKKTIPMISKTVQNDIRKDLKKAGW